MFNVQNKKLTIKGTGKALLELSAGGNSSTFNFEIVENGVNVYTYDDLLNCTNNSIEGEIICLRKSFESLETYKNKTSNKNINLQSHNLQIK